MEKRECDFCMIIGISGIPDCAFKCFQTVVEKVFLDVLKRVRITQFRLTSILHLWITIMFSQQIPILGQQDVSKDLKLSPIRWRVKYNNRNFPYKL